MRRSSPRSARGGPRRGGGFLARRYAELRTAGRPVTIEAVQQTLGDGQALVELAVYDRSTRRRRTSRGASRTYVAYVLKKSGAPRHVELGARRGD